MSNHSLMKTIHGVKAGAGEANAFQSKRWEQLEQNLCPKRDMFDIVGRGPLCADSLYAGSNGCVPAIQRINAENDNRPKYGEYIPRVGVALSGDPYESKTEESTTNRDLEVKAFNGWGPISSSIKSSTNDYI